MSKHRIVTVAFVASLATLAAWAASSVGQVPPTAEARTVIAAPTVPAAPGLPGGPAPAAMPAARGGEISFFLQGPGGEMDEETRKLHEQDRAYEQSTRQSLQEYRDAESGSDRSAILDKLSEAVQTHFEVRQQIREKELAELEARVRRLRELHDKREAAKAEIVERRVEQLTREAEGLGWSNGGDHEAWMNLPNTPFRPRIELRNNVEPRRPRTTR